MIASQCHAPPREASAQRAAAEHLGPRLTVASAPMATHHETVGEFDMAGWALGHGNRSDDDAGEHPETRLRRSSKALRRVARVSSDVLEAVAAAITGGPGPILLDVGGGPGAPPARSLPTAAMPSP
jgi:hypothetical protein